MRFFRGIHGVIAALACFFVLDASAQALAPYTKAGRPDTLVRHQEQLPEVTVSENRHQQAQRSTAPAHVLDRHDLLRMGTTDMADALHRLPGITLRDYGGAGGMKTVSVRGFGAKHTGVSYDGVVLGESQNGEIDVSRYGLDNLSSLQLTIGDNEHIFSTARQASTPALLSIETMTPQEGKNIGKNPVQGNGWAAVRMGSFGYISPMLRYERQLSSRFTVWAVGDYVYADNDYPFELRNVTVVTKEHRHNSRMNQGHGEVNARWEMSDMSTLSGKVYYYDNDRQLPGIVRYYSTVSRETLRDRNAFGQVNYQTRWHNGMSMKLTGKVNWAASFYDNGLIASQIVNGDYWQREYYASAAWLYTPALHWSLSYAADYALNNLNSTLPTDTRPRRHSILQTAAARYQKNRLTLSARLLYSVYINEEKRPEAGTGEAIDPNNHRWSPSIGLSYELMDGVRLRASFKDIFRMPTFNENYYYHFGSKTLLPEKTRQWNAGITYTHGYRSAYSQGYSLSVDAYYNQVKDMIVAVPYNMFVWRCVNVGKVRALGIDATARWQQPLSQRQMLCATANYSIQRVANRTNPQSPYYNNQIAYMPQSTGGASLSWENPWVSVSVHGEGMSSRWTNNEHLDGTLVGGYWEMGATAWRTFRLAKQHQPRSHRHEVDVRFDLKNFLNKQYEIVGAYPMPGRSWQLTLGYHF